MTDDAVPAMRTCQVAVVAFPALLDASSAVGVSEQIRAAVGNGAAVVIADMAATASCDHAGVDALIRAYHLAAVSQGELRLVVRAPPVSRMISDAGLDRLVAVFRSVETANAAEGTGGPAARDDEALQARALQWQVRPRARQSNGSGRVDVNAAVLR